MATRTRTERTWGDWIFDARDFQLTFDDGRHRLSIPLADCRDSAQVLDWIMHLRKTWVTPDDLGHLVLALGDIFQPQGNMCRGRDREIVPREIAASNGYRTGTGRAV